MFVTRLCSETLLFALLGGQSAGSSKAFHPDKAETGEGIRMVLSLKESWQGHRRGRLQQSRAGGMRIIEGEKCRPFQGIIE